MTEIGEEEQPLQALLAQAQALFAQAEAAGMASPAGQEPARQAGQLLERCADAVERLVLFSGNEDKDDLSTPDLKYLAVPYLQAEVHGQAGGGMHERLSALQAARQLYFRFLHRLQQYGLLDPETLAACERAETGERANPTTTRASKIALFKQERQVKAQLDVVTRRRLASQRAAGLAGDDDEDGICGAVVGVDADEEREAWFLQLDLYAFKAVGQLGALHQELEVLEAAAAMPEEQRAAAATSNVPSPELMRQLLGAAAGLEGQRAEIRQKLLRPSHNLPTRSLAQQADIEMAQTRQAAARQQAAEQRHAVQDSDGEEDEQELHRQRATDDWKDTHPSGYGNSKLRPTA